jgi:hypothetical protein
MFAGIRGQLHIIVKVDLFSDSNKFRQSSCGVRFFCSKTKHCIDLGFYSFKCCQLLILNKTNKRTKENK